MPAIIRSADVEKVLRQILKGEGYRLSRWRRRGETGCDVIATKGGRKIHIEVISYKKSAPARSKDFFEVFFRAVSRLKDGATQCVIALPSPFGRGLRRRALEYGIAWRRIGAAFPELEIWLINVSEMSIEQRVEWNRWLQ